MDFTSYINQNQQQGILPGLVLGYQYGYDAPVITAYGVDGAQHALTTDSLFPVASITKLALSLAILQLIDHGLIALDEAIGTYVNDIIPASAPLTIRSLLCHASGLALDLADKDGLYAIGLDWPKLAQECLNSPPAKPAWSGVQYSNLGYGLLGILIERMTGQRCADALSSLVLTPLGIRGCLGNPTDLAVATIADVRGRHRGTALETFNSPFWRNLALPWGGLCTDAAGALALVDAFLPHSDFLTPDLRDIALGDHTRGRAGGFMPPLWWNPSPWGLGPELRGTKAPHWVSPQFAPTSFGHSGASGMVVWADESSMVRIVMLGARAADSGWMLRHGPQITSLVINHLTQ
ncbi:MAG: class A beta-lactamase-related serine hydrolase [Chloroflexia bacterium]|nr:class A beta-lactamase-related serine hydrolase [Chloroflexia bacterium]